MSINILEGFQLDKTNAIPRDSSLQHKKQVRHFPTEYLLVLKYKNPWIWFYLVRKHQSRNVDSINLLNVCPTDLLTSEPQHLFNCERVVQVPVIGVYLPIELRKFMKTVCSS